ncbi:outer membrane beta-barrel protein [Agaribacterium sp. ZY112]|uniref:outer membrane beta-barrel protein n=1 Tax=Agaribacterium sp. ZY112 TaxID=3233574 RepID=UPI00352674A7
MPLNTRFLIVLSALVLSFGAQANNRQMNIMDFSLYIPWDYSKDLNTKNGSSAEIEGNHGFGLGMGYSWSDSISTRFDLQWNHRDYSGIQVSDGPLKIEQPYRSRLDSIHMDLGVDWYLIKNRPWTPFLSASVGWNFYDSNIPAGPGDCWWDPILGPVCVQSTYTEDTWSTGLAGGLRFDIGDRYFTRILYGERFINMDNINGTTNFRYSRVEFGWSY